MRREQWKAGDVCFVPTEGDEVFVIERMERRGDFEWAWFVGRPEHGRESTSRLTRLTPAQAAEHLKRCHARIDLLVATALRLGKRAAEQRRQQHVNAGASQGHER